jgi:oligopeptide transport system permease protein
LGRDVLSRLFMGTRISLLIAFIAALFDITIGVAYGLISGMLGGRVDNVMQRFLRDPFWNSQSGSYDSDASCF